MKTINLKQIKQKKAASIYHLINFAVPLKIRIIAFLGLVILYNMLLMTYIHLAHLLTLTPFTVQWKSLQCKATPPMKHLEALAHNRQCRHVHYNHLVWLSHVVSKHTDSSKQNLYNLTHICACIIHIHLLLICMLHFVTAC